MVLGHRVKQLRKENGITQRGLSDKTGISLHTIERVEAGAGWNCATVELIAETFGMTLGQLFEGVTVGHTRNRWQFEHKRRGK